MLFDQLKKDNMLALKERNALKKSILSLAISKCQLVITEKRGKGEEFSDADALNVISKLVKEVEEEALAFKVAGRDERYNELMSQKEMVSVYLPTLLSEEKIKEIISKLDDKSMPSVMKHFKENYQGQVDMSLVSKIARG